MRKMMALLTVALVGVCAADVQSVLADSDRAISRSPVSFRLASSKAIAGYEMMNLDRDHTLYVAPKAALFGDDVALAEVLDSCKSGGLDLALAPNVAGRLAAAMKKHGADSLVILVVGQVVTTGQLKVEVNGNRALLTGVAPTHINNLLNLLNGATPVGPTITVVPSQSSMRPGGTMTVDVFANGVGDLRVYQVSLAVTGGMKGRLAVDSAAITSRDDYVFGTAKKLDAVDQTSGRMGAMLFDGGMDVATPGYLGTYTLRASADASGSYSVNVRMDRSSFLRDSKNMTIGFYPGQNAIISVGTPSRKQPRGK